MAVKNNKNYNIAGQAMLLAVLLVGTSILTITSIAGYLTLQRIRMSSNFVDSTKAILAAETGIECEFYNYFKQGNIKCNELSFTDSKIKIQTSTSTNNGALQIKSIGDSNKSKRAFMIKFNF